MDLRLGSVGLHLGIVDLRLGRVDLRLGKPALYSALDCIDGEHFDVPHEPSQTEITVPRHISPVHK